MKAISLWQPWASASVRGAKKHETRHWEIPPAMVGQRIAIHAAKRWTKEEREFLGYCWEGDIDAGIPSGETPPLGAIVGVVTFTAPILITDEWAIDLLRRDGDDWELGNYDAGRFAWPMISRVALKEPIPCKGAQGFFNVPALEQALLDIQLAGMAMSALQESFK